MTHIAERIQQIKDNIAAVCARIDRQDREVKLVIVTKSTTLDNIKETIRLGYIDLGENRVQQLRRVSTEIEHYLQHASSSDGLPDNVNWHMVGHLQRNKVKQVLPIISLIHSVDTLRLAEEINTSAEKLNLCPRILMQVNTSHEPQKYGVPVGAAIYLAEQLQTMPNLKLAGLMVMAPLTRNTDVIRDCFARARELFLEIKGAGIVGPDFCELSMGMSSDYEIAVEQGATIIRIGSAIFAG